jgi:hypothetical protein
MQARTPARKVHVVPVAIPGLVHHHLVLENGKAEGLGIEELVGDARHLRPVHQQDRAASRVELPLPPEHEAWGGGDVPASPIEGWRQNE